MAVFLAWDSFGQTAYVIYNNTATTNSYRVVRTPDIVNSPGVQTSINTHNAVLPGTYVNGTTGSSANGQTVRCKYSSGPDVFMAPTGGYLQVGANNPVLMTFTDGQPVTNCLFQFSVQNNTAGIQTFYASRSQVIDMGKTLTLHPGASGILQFNALCSDSNLWDVLWAPFGEPFELDMAGQVTPVGTSPTNRAPVIADDPAPVAYNPTNNVGTNSPIKWEVSTNNQQDGFNALFEAITKGNARQDINMTTLISNFTSTSTGETGIVAAINSFHNDATNATGAQIRFTEMSNDLNNVTGQAQTATNGLGSMFGGIADTEFEFSAPAVEQSFWEVQIVQGVASTKVNFNPLGALSGVAATMKRILQWALLVGYCVLVIRDIVLAMSTMHQTTQISTPNIQATFLGVGGNWGASLGPLYVAAWLGIWGVLVGSLGGLAGGIISSETVAFLRAGPMGTVSGPVAQGWAIASAFVPWAAIVSMTFAAIVWKVSHNVAINLARIFSKLMVGS